MLKALGIKGVYHYLIFLLLITVVKPSTIDGQDYGLAGKKESTSAKYSQIEQGCNKKKSSSIQQQLKSGQTAQGIDQCSWASIQEQIEMRPYKTSSNESGGYHSANPRQGFQIQYKENGHTHLTPYSRSSTKYSIAMHLAGIGYVNNMQEYHKPLSLHKSDMGIGAGSKVSYQWSSQVTEWWINDIDRLEQWFYIKEAPEGKTDGSPLKVQLALDTDMTFSLKNNKLNFNKGSHHIQYDKLKVWDATGKVLDSRIELETTGFSLVVNDDNATYPLTIDPTITQDAYLKGSNINQLDYFGSAVAISGDIMAISASNYGDQGAVYVFARNGTNWTEQAFLQSAGASSDGYYGNSIALSGKTLVVGESYDRSNATGVNGDHLNQSLYRAGAAYVYIRNGTTWTQQAYLKASNTEDSDRFGISVDISGETIVVGASGEDSNASGVNGGQADNSLDRAGAAYVFVRTGGLNGTWSQQAYIKPTDSSEIQDEFGYSVAISGETIVVGAPEHTTSTVYFGVGKAYVYVRSGTTWTGQAKLTASNPGARDAFAVSVDISGETIVVGANKEDEVGNAINNSGAAYVFVRSGSSWTEQALLRASNPEEEDEFGGDLAIDGETIVVGAFGEDSNATGINGNETNNSAAEAGAAYVFKRNGATWTQEAYLKASNTEANDYFGISVAIDGWRALLGAPYEDSNATTVNGDETNNAAENAGAAYLFSLIPPLQCNMMGLTPTCSGSDGTGSINIDLDDSVPHVPPYTYSYTGPTSGTAAANSEPFSLQNLSDGTYSITVTDATGIECSDDVMILSIAGSFFEITEIATTNEGGGGANGAMTINTGGGAANYTYAWSGPSSGSSSAVAATTYTVSNLSAGDYDITVTDDNGETILATVTILNEATTTQCNSPVDILVLNDVSGSVDGTEYTQSKEFFVDFANALNIGTGATDSRMGIAEWSSTGYWEERIALGGSTTTLQGYDGYSRLFEGGTNPLYALTRGYNYMEANARPDIPKVLILATDAYQNQITNSFIALSQQYQAMGYTIVTIAFDDAFSDPVTRNILAEASSFDYSYGVNSYAELGTDLASKIVNLQICTANPGSTNTINFLRDGTFDITAVTPVGICPDLNSLTVNYTVCAQQQLSLPAGIPISFYNGNPDQAGASLLATAAVPCAVAAGTCENLSIDIPLNGPTHVYGVLNDLGTENPPISFPNTGIEEVSYFNNIDDEIVLGGSCAPATLVATKTALSAQPVCGNTVVYEVTVCNVGTADASGVVVTDDAPAGFVLSSNTENLNACASGGGTYTIPADCCISILYEYDASAAANGLYDDQDVLLSGPVGPTYVNFDGATSATEDVTVTGVPDCPSDIVLWTQAVSTTDICEESFVTYTFTIDNQTNVELLNLSFDMTLPSPVIFAAEPYLVNNLSLNATNITGTNSTSFLIASVPSNTVATFNIDVYLGDWTSGGSLNAAATLGNLPGFANGSGADLISTPPSITVHSLPDVEAGSDQTIYSNGTADLTGTIANGTINTWGTGGDGTFSNPNSLTTTYTPGPNDIAAGYATLNLIGNALTAACFSDLDRLRIDIVYCGTKVPVLSK